jgi:hypothetical protein
MATEYVKKIFKYVKKVNMYGYNVHLREGRHHQHIKFTKIEHKYKKKVVKERRPRQEATISIREWTSGGESSSSSSSDESRKNFTPASCKVLHHHYTCALWPKVWKAM